MTPPPTYKEFKDIPPFWRADGKGLLGDMATVSDQRSSVEVPDLPVRHDIHHRDGQPSHLLRRYLDEESLPEEGRSRARARAYLPFTCPNYETATLTVSGVSDCPCGATSSESFAPNGLTQSGFAALVNGVISLDKEEFGCRWSKSVVVDPPIAVSRWDAVGCSGSSTLAFNITEILFEVELNEDGTLTVGIRASADTVPADVGVAFVYGGSNFAITNQQTCSADICHDGTASLVFP